MSKSMNIGEITGPEGQWLVVVRGEVVAHSDDAGEMFKFAERYPSTDTVVTRVPFPQASFY
jgi:hypothetical protein